jgi:hypothetical protein
MHVTEPKFPGFSKSGDGFFLRALQCQVLRRVLRQRRSLSLGFGRDLDHGRILHSSACQHGFGSQIRLLHGSFYANASFEGPFGLAETAQKVPKGGLDRTGLGDLYPQRSRAAA